MSLQIHKFPYKVESIKIKEGSINEVELTFAIPGIQANSVEEYKALCEQQASYHGVDNEITVFHTSVTHQLCVGHIVGVQFVYEDTPYINDYNVRQKLVYQLIEYQELC